MPVRMILLVLTCMVFFGDDTLAFFPPTRTALLPTYSPPPPPLRVIGRRRPSATSIHAAIHAISLGSNPPTQKRRRKSKDSPAEPIPQQRSNDRSDCSDRFDREADTERCIDDPCILTIRGMRYNMTAWARAHPGGPNILKRFHGKDCTAAFDAAGHSDMAYAMLDDFLIGPADAGEPSSSSSSSADATDLTPTPRTPNAKAASTSAGAAVTQSRKVPRWRAKLFTSEDPIGIHKYMGLFSLLHFAYRYRQMFFGDPSAGLGTRLGKGPSLFAILTLLPHGILSASSLIFHTVPKERVVGKPMIWQEFRMHNIIFGLRSVFATFLAWLAIYDPSAKLRRRAITLSATSVLVANILADLSTSKLRQNDVESTTATMPYWEGCSVDTQRRFKTFYAYCQFLATLACVACSNPAWPLCVLLPIQLASLLMTLVRKGLISARAYHVCYTASLCMPFLVGLRGAVYARSLDFPFVMALGWAMYQLRRKGVSKYLLWAPVVAGRVVAGDSILDWKVW